MSKIRFELYLEPEQLKRLEAIAKRTKVSVASLVRLAIDNMLKPGAEK